MCGIYATLTTGENNHSIASLLAFGLHRGPDQSGSTVIALPHRTQLALGAHRLKISDRTDGSQQPMADAHKNWLVYNGELYNAYEWRNRILGTGQVTFRSAGDTEVLLHALSQAGLAALPQLNGMFAFVYWHREKQEIWAARDALGIKPLYYRDFDWGRAFASEAKALAALEGAHPDSAEIPHLLQHRYPAGTGYHGVQEVAPGTCHTWSAEGGWQTHQWAHPPAPMEQQNTPPEKELQERLTDALLRHMESQVYMGMYLSGGVDSTLLLALMHAEGLPRFPALTVRHRKQDLAFGTSDGAFAEQAAKQFGTTLASVEITPQDLQRFPEYIAAMDVPVGDSGGFLTWLMAEKSRELGWSVVLSGAGADELFGGYNRHAALGRYLKRPDFWQKARPFLQSISPLLPTGKGIPGRAYFQLLRKFAQRLDVDPARTFWRFQQLSLPPGIEPSFAASPSTANWLTWALEEDTTTYLPQDVLRISDTFTMAHSVELRVPYLDQELAAWVRSIPGAYHLQHGPKWMLKELLTQLGGKAYATRPKAGLGLPLGAWIRKGEANDWLALLDRDDLTLWEHLDPAGPRQWVKAQRAGRADFAQEIWNVMTMAAWMEHTTHGSMK